MRYTLSKLGFAILCLIFVGASSAEPAAKPPQRWTSIVALLSNPNIFDKQRIVTVGYLRLEHRGSELFLHGDDAQNGFSENAIPVEFNSNDKDIIDRLTKYNNHYVRIRGKFIAYAPEKRVVSMGYIEIEKVIFPGEYFDDEHVAP